MANSNINAYFKALYTEANRLSRLEQFEEADQLCFQLLRDPTCPIAYRAGCNLLLSCGEDMPVEFAKEAVKWYQEMYDQVREDGEGGPDHKLLSHHKLLLEQAHDAVESAKQRVAERAKAEVGDEGDEGEEHEEVEEEDRVGKEELEGHHDTEMVDATAGDKEKGAEEEVSGESQEFDSQATAVALANDQLIPSSPGDTAIGSSQAKKDGSSSDEMADMS